MTLANLHDVRFTYAFSERPALDGLSLQWEEGRVHGVVGLNASGKSTLCALLRGIIPHFHSGELTGQVEILGRELSEWDPAELSTTIGCVFDNPFTQISGIRDTVFEEIAIGLENLGMPRDELIDRVVAVVRRLGIEKNPNGLSGGQRQKVAFASIIAMDAEVMVIDEPTSQLDPESSEEVFEIIHGLKDAGKSIVLVEHKIDLLAAYADTITVLREGAVAMSGPTRDVLGAPELPSFGVRPPEVVELAVRLSGDGRDLGVMPMTRAEATRAVGTRMEEAHRAH